MCVHLYGNFTIYLICRFLILLAYIVIDACRDGWPWNGPYITPQSSRKVSQFSNIYVKFYLFNQSLLALHRTHDPVVKFPLTCLISVELHDECYLQSIHYIVIINLILLLLCMVLYT